MSFEIPEPFCWDESFATFYAQIDEEHKGLFKGIFDCAAKPGCADSLAALYKKVEDHFTYEEGEMQKAKYDEFAAHKPLHTDFLAKLKGLSAPLSDAQIHFAKDWLVNHIKVTDFKYKGKL
jgi:hemerythrin family non-heme iron protein